MFEVTTSSEYIQDENPEYVFFCEGKTEERFMDLLQTIKQHFKNVTLSCYKIPRAQNEGGSTWFFTPKRVADYCEMVQKYARDEEDVDTGPYNYNFSSSEKITKDNKIRILNLGVNKKIFENLEKGKKNLKICVLVDSDVFFRGYESQRYSNFSDEERQNYEFVREYMDVLENSENYTFCEQELNFEDFFVACFLEYNEQRYWFDTIRRYDKSDAYNRLYKWETNGKMNGNEIKQSLNDMLKTMLKTTRDDWLNKIDIVKSIENCINNTIPKNKRCGWPYHFGLVNILGEYVKD